MGNVFFWRRFWFFGIIVLLLVFAFLIKQIKVMDISYKLQTLENETRILRLDNERMQIILAKDTGLEKIEKISLEKLKMIRPTRIQYIVLTR